MINKTKIKLFISQRILTPYREEAFYLLAMDDNIRMLVAFGDRKSKKYRKYASIKSTPRFPHVRLVTLSLIFELFNNVNQFFFSPGVLRQLMKYKPDVVLTEGTSNILNNLLICTYSLMTKTPYIWWDLGRIRGQDKENKFRRILYPLISFYFRRAAIILGYSSFAREYFLSIGIPTDRIIVAGNTLGLDRHLQFQSTKKKNAEKLKMELKLVNHFVFLTVGALEKPKRFELLVDSFRKLSQKHKDISLVIVGEGPEKENLEGLSGGNTNIHFAGAQFENIGLYFMVADIFVMPGLGGLAINEAMAYGLPVISGPADGTELDLIRNYETGFLLEDNLLENLYHKMEWCLTHREEVREMGIRGKELILNHYSLAKMVDKIKSAILKAYHGSQK